MVSLYLCKDQITFLTPNKVLNVLISSSSSSSSLSLFQTKKEKKTQAHVDMWITPLRWNPVRRRTRKLAV